MSRLTMLLPILVAILFVAASSVFTVDEREKALVLQFIISLSRVYGVVPLGSHADAMAGNVSSGERQTVVLIWIHSLPSNMTTTGVLSCMRNSGHFANANCNRVGTST